MKKIRMIQNVMIIIGIVTAVALVDQIEVSSSRIWAAVVIVAFTIITIIERGLPTSNK